MNAYIWTLVILFALEIVGKAVWLAKQDFVRTANSMIIDIAMLVGLIIWGIWLLAATPYTP